MHKLTSPSWVGVDPSPALEAFETLPSTVVVLGTYTSFTRSHKEGLDMMYNNISGMMKMPLWLQLLPSTFRRLKLYLGLWFRRRHHLHSLNSGIN